MDELVISGKRYISSRRAAKENRYHTDYIGQLVRARKIAGKKVGRAWYIDAESLSRYVQAEKNGTEADIDADEFAEVAGQHTEMAHQLVTPEPTEARFKKEAEETISVGFSTQYSPVQPAMPRPQAPHVFAANYDIHPIKPVLQYIADDEPFTPKISQYEEVVAQSARAEVAPSVPILRPIAQTALPRTKTNTRRRLMLPVVFAALALVAGFFASTALRYKIVTNQTGTTASVILSR